MTPERIAELRSKADQHATVLGVREFGDAINEALDALEEAEARLSSVHIAAPAAIGDNVLRFAPDGPVLLTAAQRADLLRQIDGAKRRISDLKFALGDDASWFDRYQAEKRRADAATKRAEEAEARAASAEGDTALLRQLGRAIVAIDAAEAEAQKRPGRKGEYEERRRALFAARVIADRGLEAVRARAIALAREGQR